MKRILTAAIAAPLLFAGCAAEPQDEGPALAPATSAAPSFARTIALDYSIPASVRASDETIHECLDLVEAEYPAGEKVNATVDEATEGDGFAMVSGETQSASRGTMLFACQSEDIGKPLELAFHGTVDEW